MKNVTDNFDAISTLSKYPSFVCEAISLYYPLPLEWMRTYGDILKWGGIVNADISAFSSQDFYEPGIIFNSAIEWNWETRALVLANLMTKGEDLSINSDDLLDRHSPNEKLSAKLSALVSFVQKCPLKIEDVLESYVDERGSHYKLEFMEHFGVDPDDNAFATANPRYWETRNRDACRESVVKECAPQITGELSTSDLVLLLKSNKVPDLLWNEKLWTLTLSDIFTPHVTEELLHSFWHSKYLKF